ncbi:MAG: tetratricopeptide repeat protein [Planctomycetota bacterium]
MQRKIFTATVLGSLAVLAGCNQPTDQQRMWLAEGERAYKQQHYEQAVQQLSQFVNAAPQRPEVGRALYVRALAQAHQNERSQARSDLERCVRSTDDPDVRWRAYAVLGTLDYEDGQWATAGRVYAAAIADAPREPPTDVMLFRLGVCCERSGRWDDARGPYQRLLVEYPESKLRDSAQRRLDINADHFAIQCGLFSSSENAENMMHDLERNGMVPRIRRETRNRAIYHVVLVGRYGSYEEALRDLARVKGYVPKAVIWP